MARVRPSEFGQITLGTPTRELRVDERLERFGWQHGFKWCAWATSADLAGSLVVVNAWSRERARRKLRSLWMEHVRFVTDDKTSAILCWYRPASPGKGGGVERRVKRRPPSKRGTASGRGPAPRDSETLRKHLPNREPASPEQEANHAE